MRGEFGRGSAPNSEWKKEQRMDEAETVEIARQPDEAEYQAVMEEMIAAARDVWDQDEDGEYYPKVEAVRTKIYKDLLGESVARYWNHEVFDLLVSDVVKRLLDASRDEPLLSWNEVAFSGRTPSDEEYDNIKQDVLGSVHYSLDGVKKDGLVGYGAKRVLLESVEELDTLLTQSSEETRLNRQEQFEKRMARDGEVHNNELLRKTWDSKSLQRLYTELTAYIDEHVPHGIEELATEPFLDGEHPHAY